MERYLKEAAAGPGAHPGDAVLLAAAAVELLRSHPLLGDHAVGLGYVDKLLRLLAARLPPPSAPLPAKKR